MTISFRSSSHLTLGVEMEVQLIEQDSLDLSARSDEILRRFADEPRFKREFFKGMLEVNTGICDSVHTASGELRELIDTLNGACTPLGLICASTGTHPTARYADRRLSGGQRYRDLMHRHQWVARRMCVFGVHVHLGMRSADACIDYYNFFLHFLPHLLALSASSPFWQGELTGLASSRVTVYEASPTSGHVGALPSWEAFEKRCSALSTCGSMASFKDLWWDMRPSPTYGTLEIRMCDGVATLQELTAIVAYIHGLAHWFDKCGPAAAQELGLHPAPSTWRIRENKWRAARHGVDGAQVLDDSGRSTPISDVVRSWLGRLDPTFSQLDYGCYVPCLRGILADGASHLRQRRTFDRNRCLRDVVLHNCREFQNGAPIHQAQSADRESILADRDGQFIAIPRPALISADSVPEVPPGVLCRPETEAAVAGEAD